MTDTEFAKNHLRDHLGSLIVSPIADGFWSIQSSASELCARNKTPDQVIRTFQNMLTKIPDWSEHTLSTEVERIQKVSKCPYLDDLMMGVFIAYMKSFASLHYSGSQEIEIDFDRPTLAKFIHEVYIESARKLWQTAFLFKTDGVPSETQAKSRDQIEKIINACVEQVIRNFLPWSSITKKYFSTPSTSEPPKAVEEDTKRNVTFNQEDDEEEEYEVESEEEDAPPPALKISDEDASLDIPELQEEEVDPMKELEKKVSETLVLNL